MSFQTGLKSKLESLSAKARTKILNIKTGNNFWSVRSNALNEYNDAHKEYQKSKTLNITSKDIELY